MPGVGTTDFAYVKDSPNAQSFSLFDTSQPLDACSSPEILNGSTWDPISADPDLSIDYTTGQLTYQPSNTSGLTIQMRIGSTQFKLHRCEYAYVSTVGIPDIPAEIDVSTGQTNTFVIPKIQILPNGSNCPVATKPTISGITASSYLESGTGN